MIRGMSHFIRTGVMESRSAAGAGGVWEVVGVLAAVIPCGILAGLYLATSDPIFLVSCAVFAVAAVGIIIFLRPGRFSWKRRRGDNGGGDTRGGAAGTDISAPTGPAFTRIFTLRFMKLIALVAWLLAWGVLATLYARVAQNANIAALAMLVAVGGFSPVVIYFGLEMGVKKASRRSSAGE